MLNFGGVGFSIGPLVDWLPVFLREKFHLQLPEWSGSFPLNIPDPRRKFWMEKMGEALSTTVFYLNYLNYDSGYYGRVRNWNDVETHFSKVIHLQETTRSQQTKKKTTKNFHRMNFISFPFLIPPCFSPPLKTWGLERLSDSLSASRCGAHHTLCLTRPPGWALVAVCPRLVGCL